MKPADPSSEPLTMTVHEMAAPEVDAGARTAAGRWKMLLVLAMCAAPVVASYFTYFVIRPEGRSNYGDLISPAVGIPDQLPLTDLSGRPVDASSLKGQWLLVVVAAGRCDAACERHLLFQRQLRETLGREKDRVDKVWLITDDAPLRPELAQAIAATPAVTALRVPPKALAQWLAPAAGQSLDAHLYLVDPMGAWMMRAPAQVEPAKFKRDVERLLRASSSWDRPGR